MHCLTLTAHLLLCTCIAHWLNAEDRGADSLTDRNATIQVTVEWASVDNQLVGELGIAPAQRDMQGDDDANPELDTYVDSGGQLCRVVRNAIRLTQRGIISPVHTVSLSNDAVHSLVVLDGVVHEPDLTSVGTIHDSLIALLKQHGAIFTLRAQIDGDEPVIDVCLFGDDSEYHVPIPLNTDYIIRHGE